MQVFRKFDSQYFEGSLMMQIATFDKHETIGNNF
jgi:hypothetical protein